MAFLGKKKHRRFDSPFHSVYIEGLEKTSQFYRGIKRAICIEAFEQGTVEVPRCTRSVAESARLDIVCLIVRNAQGVRQKMGCGVFLLPSSSVRLKLSAQQTYYKSVCLLDSLPQAEDVGELRCTHFFTRN